MPPKRAAAGAGKRKAAASPEPSPDPSTESHFDSASEGEGEASASAAEAEHEPAPKKRKTGSGKAAPGAKAKTKADAEGSAKPKAAVGKAKAKAKAGDAKKGKGKRDAKKAEGGSEGAQPTNKVLPAHIEFPPRADGALRIAAWNICGLAAAQKKGFTHYVEAEDPDVLVLTETKVNNEPADPALSSRFAHRYWSISDKKTYSGTAILSKVEPLSVDYTLPGHPDPKSVKGRIVTLEFAGCFLVGTYVVNAGTGLKTLDAKKEWNTHFEAYIRDLDKRKPVIWTGDLNVAPTALDLTNPKPNWNKTPGYTEAETSAFARVLNASAEEADGPQFVDVWRKLHPALKHYTYFSYRFNCREKGIGWRLDHFVVSERLAGRVQMCEIRDEIYGASDHCPVIMELAGPL